MMRLVVGEVSDEAKLVTEISKKARDSAIAICGPGVNFMEIGCLIGDLARRNKLSVMKDFVGHGVGRVFHAAPFVHHHTNRYTGTMQENMTFTIEPILCIGNRKPAGAMNTRYSYLLERCFDALLLYCVSHIVTCEFCSGPGNRYNTWDDKWTVVDPRGNLSAQWEHTILITKGGSEILTKL